METYLVRYLVTWTANMGDKNDQAQKWIEWTTKLITKHLECHFQLR